MNIAIFGLEQIQAQLTTGIAQMTAKIDREVQRAGISCERYAKQMCPVDTGRLRSSIQYANKGLQQCICETTVNYALFVELGTSKMGAQPFMTPAYEEAKVELIANLKALRV